MALKSFSVIFLLLLLVVVFVDGATQPHIIFFMADDYGWANVGYHKYDTTKPLFITNSKIKILLQYLSRKFKGDNYTKHK
jgi:hypothetical protein